MASGTAEPPPALDVTGNGRHLPERGKHIRRSTFPKVHLKILGASDFFSVEVWTPEALVTHYILFAFSLANRVVHVAGNNANPTEALMLQVARNLIDHHSGALASKRFHVIDRNTKYTPSFGRLLKDSGTEVIRLPALSPNLNAHAERPL